MVRRLLTTVGDYAGRGLNVRHPPPPPLPPKGGWGTFLKTLSMVYLPVDTPRVFGEPALEADLSAGLGHNVLLDLSRQNARSTLEAR
jgi:hypothetical protein